MNVPVFPPNSIIHEKYVVVDEIARGTFGKVLKVKEINNDDDTYVMKVQDCTENNASYLAEFLVLGRCRGVAGFPFLLDRFSFVRNDQHLGCLVTSDEGETFRTTIQRRNFFILPSNILKIGWRILAALTHLHGLGLIHCDLHFLNVLFRRNWAGELLVTLIDFGHCRSQDSPNRRFNGVKWHTPIRVAQGQDYTIYDDIVSMTYLLGLCCGVNPFGNDENTFLDRKVRFHADPMSYFGLQITQWIPNIHKILDRQRQQGYNREEIVRMFKTCIPEVDPADDIVYTFAENHIHIH